MATSKTKEALRFEKRASGVAILWFDIPGEPVNTLKETFTKDFEEAFSALEADKAVKAVVFASAKKTGFVVGADIGMLEKVDTAEAGELVSRRAQAAMNRLERFKKPVVAAINGPCLGGGLELALACHARIASDSKKTKLGLPEVQLGLLPGAGGTQRLPALIGVQAALDLMLTGKQVRASKAKKLGLVDDVCAPAILVDVAERKALSMLKKSKKKSSPFDKVKELLDGDELQEMALAENPLGRMVLFDQARKKLREKTLGNYPAPERILDAVKAGLESGPRKGYEVEARGFGQLLMSPESKQLINIFRATTAMKKDNGVSSNVKPRNVSKVGMVGAGLMGAGIAYVTSAVAKKPVRLKDRDAKGILGGMKYIGGIVDGRVKRRRMKKFEADYLMRQISPTTSYTGLKDAEVVIEAVFEDLKLKHKILKDVEANGHPEVIFATNTSSLPITEIAKGSAHPETVIGMHYFSPVHKMPLLEVIVTDKTADWVTATCVELGKKQGKTVIVVGDGVGFYTTRVLAPFCNEASYILSEGVPIEKIDGALKKFGFPVGPIKLADEVGIDVGAKIGKIMLDAFGERMAPPKGMEKVIKDGRQGRKNGKGFYLYGGKKKGVDPTIYDVIGVKPNNTKMKDMDIAWRCALTMVNEAARCLEEGILRSPRDGDIGAIFGLGFPPFRGGPFRFVDATGAKEIVKRLRTLEKKYGKRFAPAQILIDKAESGELFYSEGSTKAAKKPAAKKPATKTAAAKKPAAKKTTKKVTAKKAVKKAATKKTAKKKASAKKRTAKKAATKKRSTKKAATKKRASVRSRA